jgi:hypothetical protein
MTFHCYFSGSDLIDHVLCYEEGFSFSSRLLGLGWEFIGFVLGLV